MSLLHWSMAPVRHKNLIGEIGCPAGTKVLNFLGLNSQQLVWNHAFLLTYPKPLGDFVLAALCCGGVLPLLGKGHWSGLNKHEIWAKYSRKTVPEDLDTKDHRETGLWARSKDNRRDNLENPRVWMSTSVCVHKWTSHTHTVIAPKLYIMCLK